MKDYNANKINPVSVSEWIKFHRLKMGWSQMQLAQNLGLNQKQGRYLIKDYETRGLYPPPELSQKLSILFKIGTKYFYDEYYEFIDSNYDTILKKWREKNNLTQKQAAKILGITNVTWSKWEHKKNVPNRKAYNRLMKTL